MELVYGEPMVAIHNGELYYYYQMRNLVKDEDGNVSHSSYIQDVYLPWDGGEKLWGFH